MEVLLNDTITTEELMNFERKYKGEELMGEISTNTQFEYAWCLIRSPYKNDWKDGIQRLKSLFEKDKDVRAQRDYLYYISIGYAKLKDYEKALECCDGILYVQPQNHQAKQMKEFIEKKMKKEGLMGMAVIGGAGLVVGVGAAVLAAFAASRSR